MTNPYGSGDEFNDSPNSRANGAHDYGVPMDDQQAGGAGSYPSMPAYDPMTSVDETAMVQRPGAWRRLLSYIIDSVLVGLVSTPIVMLITPPSEIMDWVDKAFQGEVADMPTGLNFMGLIALVIWFVYRAAMESSNMKASVGKLLTGQRVVNFEGGKITFTQSLIRNSYYFIAGLLGIIPFASTIYYIIYGVLIARDPYNQSHTDKWAKAYVINA